MKDLLGWNENKRTSSMDGTLTHPLTTRGRARFKVGWAAHIHGGCPGWCFGWFRVQSCFHDFWCPFTFMFTSIGHQQRGGGYPQCLVVCPACFHSSTWGGERWWLAMVRVMRKGGNAWPVMGDVWCCDCVEYVLASRIWVSSMTQCHRSALSPFGECDNLGISSTWQSRICRTRHEEYKPSPLLLLERCKVPSQRVVDWASGGIVVCIYSVWHVYLLCTWLCSGTWNPYSTLLVEVSVVYSFQEPFPCFSDPLEDHVPLSLPLQLFCTITPSSLVSSISLFSIPTWSMWYLHWENVKSSDVGVLHLMSPPSFCTIILSPNLHTGVLYLFFSTLRWHSPPT